MPVQPNSKISGPHRGTADADETALREVRSAIQVASEGVAASIDGPVIDAMLRLGGRLLGGPLEIVATDAEPSAMLKGHCLELGALHALHGLRGETYGTLKIADIRARPSLDAHERRTFEDVATAISGYLDAEGAIGKVDHVTRLPNREQFLADIKGRQVLPDDAEAHLLGLMTLADAKHFNEILRALGHSFADDFVRTGAKLLRDELPTGTRLYHVSVLSFAWVLEGGDAVPAIIPSLVRRFAAPIAVDGIPVAARVGFGIARFDPGQARPADTLRAALAAAQHSRLVDKGWAIYDKASDDAHLRAFALITDLRTALNAGDQLSLNFQPRVDLKTGECRSAEALLRWTHPRFGNVSPGEFIPLAETTAVIGPLTEWVLRAAAVQANLWRRGGFDLVMSANISPNNLREPDFVERLAQTLKDNDLKPGHLELELTESALTPSEGGARRQLERLRDLGVEISIDDFGAGYSNLRYLTSLPASTVKIDQSFVRPLDTEPKNQLLVRSIIDMAHGLGYRVVAEGIETQATYGLVSGWGCDQGQGYFMSRPLIASALETWLRR